MVKGGDPRVFKACARRSHRPTHPGIIFAARCPSVRLSPSTRERLPARTNHKENCIHEPEGTPQPVPLSWLPAQPWGRALHPQDCGAGPKDQMRYPTRSGRCHPVSARMESPSPFPARLAIVDPGRSRFCRSRPKIREKDRPHRPTKPCFPRRKSREILPTILRTIVQRGPTIALDGHADDADDLFPLSSAERPNSEEEVFEL